MHLFIIYINYNKALIVPCAYAILTCRKHAKQVCFVATGSNNLFGLFTKLLINWYILPAYITNVY